LDALPPCPALVPWRGADLLAVCRACSPRKSPGADGWSVAQLRGLPLAWWDALADLLRSDCPIDRKMRDQVCGALNRLTRGDDQQFSFPLLLPETELEVIRAPRD